MPYRNYKTGCFWAFSYAIALEVIDIHMSFFYVSSLILSVNSFGSYFSSWATPFKSAIIKKGKLKFKSILVCLKVCWASLHFLWTFEVGIKKMKY